MLYHIEINIIYLQRLFVTITLVINCRLFPSTLTAADGYQRYNKAAGQLRWMALQMLMMLYTHTERLTIRPINYSAVAVL